MNNTNTICLSTMRGITIGKLDSYRRMACIRVLADRFRTGDLTSDQIMNEIMHLNDDDCITYNIEQGLLGNREWSDVINNHWDVFSVILEYLMYGGSEIDRSFTNSEYIKSCEIALDTMRKYLSYKIAN